MYSPSDDADPAVITDKTEFFTVVGVVKEMKLRNLTDGDNNLVGAYFFPMDQDGSSSMTFAIRTAGEALRPSVLRTGGRAACCRWRRACLPLVISLER